MTDNRQDARYQARGVSAGKAEVHAAIAKQDKGLFPGAFCKIVPDHLAEDAQQCLLVHADGAGTKSALAYLAWREGFPETVFQGIAQDSLVMNIDDCACVGALGPYLVSNTIGRNAKRVPGSIIAQVVAGYQAVCEDLEREGIRCIMTGGETADVGDVVRTLICDSTVVTRLRRNQVIDAARMVPGDVIIGFSSTGQARWERTPNSGMGSNGLTSARHEALGDNYRAGYPESYAPETPAEFVYCGKHRLSDPLPGDARFTVGSALLSPTRTYLPLIRDLIAAVGVHDLHGLIHCSGGGQTKIISFGHGNRYVKEALPPPPPLFRMIQDVSRTPWAEMYSVYNMGVRLEAIVPAARAQACLDVAKACNIDAWVTGHVEASQSPGNEVLIHGEGGSHSYAKS